MSDNQVSIKELASKLKVSDALLKKFIKDFDIATVRDKKLVYVSNESSEILKEIIRLRDAGKKNIEIKKLFEEAQKAIAQETAAIAETSSPAEPSPEAAAPAAVETVAKAEEPVTTPNASPIKAEPNHNISEEYFNEYLSEQIAEPETEVISLAMQQAESGSIEELETRDQQQHQHLEEEAPDEEGDDDDERDSSGNKRRRRQFSFRFIQRQIANDLKRVNYIRNKLQRGKLSTLEKLHLEDSLEKRSSLLKGWTHLLRWVKN